MISTPGGEPNPISPSLNRFGCASPPGEPLGIPAVYGDVLSRPAVRAAPGGIDSVMSDPDARTLDISGTTERRGCGLRLFFPGGRGKPVVSDRRIDRLRIDRVLGNWVVRGCAKPGAYSLVVSPR